MDLPGRASSRLLSKRAALSSLDNNADGPGPESDSSSRPLKKARNTSRIPSKAFQVPSAQREESKDNEEAVVPAKQPEGQKPSEVPVQEQGGKGPAVSGQTLVDKQPGGMDNGPRLSEDLPQAQEAAGQAPPAEDGEGVDGGPGANGQRPSEDGKGPATSGAADTRTDGPIRKERTAGTVLNGAGATTVNGTETFGQGRNTQAAASVNAGVDMGTRARAADAAGQGPKASAAHPPNAAAGESADAAANAGGSPRAGHGTAREEVEKDLPGVGGRQGPGRCTYARCTYVRGREGEAPDESRRGGASKACKECGACLHNLCCQEITGVEEDFTCEKCYIGQSRPGSRDADGPEAKKPRRKVTGKGPSNGAPKKGRKNPQSTGFPSAAPAAAPPQTGAHSGCLGREGRNGGRLGVVACPKCNLEQASGRKYCQDASCKAPIREARAAVKLAIENEAMRAAEKADTFSMTSASKSVHEFAKKRVVLASGGRAEGVLMLAHRKENGDKSFRFFGLGQAATVFAKNPTVQASFKSHMERSYKHKDEAQARAAKDGERPSTDDIEVENFLKSLGNDFVPYAEKFRVEGFTMAALKLAKDENLAALGIRMGPRIRILDAANAYNGKSVEDDKGPVESSRTAASKSQHEEGCDSDDEAGSVGVL